MPADIAAMKAANAKRWPAAKVTTRLGFSGPAQKAFLNKPRYLSIAKRAGMPDIGWLFIACSHYRESSQDFTKNLGQGDPLGEVTTHVPAGRGPFTGPTAFEDGAVDALVNCAPHAARLTDWSIGGMLTNLERYNGTGYFNRGVPSPYVWSGTDQYQAGKYVADGVYDPTEVDKQLGCAGLILSVMVLDPSIKFDATAQTEQPIHDGVWLQTALNKLGANPQIEVDGIVGPATRNAVRAFQLSQNLVTDGLVGTATFAALDAALAAGKTVPTMPVPPEIVLPPPGTKAHSDLAPTFWGRVLDLFKPKGS